MIKHVILIGPMFSMGKISPRIIIGPFDTDSEAFWFDGPEIEMQQGEFMTYATMVTPNAEGLATAKQHAAEAEAHRRAEEEATATKGNFAYSEH